MNSIPTSTNKNTSFILHSTSHDTMHTTNVMNNFTDNSFNNTNNNTVNSTTNTNTSHMTPIRTSIKYTPPHSADTNNNTNNTNASPLSMFSSIIGHSFRKSHIHTNQIVPLNTDQLYIPLSTSTNNTSINNNNNNNNNNMLPIFDPSVVIPNSNLKYDDNSNNSNEDNSDDNDANGTLNNATNSKIINIIPSELLSQTTDNQSSTRLHLQTDTNVTSTNTTTSTTATNNSTTANATTTSEDSIRRRITFYPSPPKLHQHQLQQRPFTESSIDHSSHTSIQQQQRSNQTYINDHNSSNSHSSNTNSPKRRVSVSASSSTIRHESLSPHRRITTMSNFPSFSSTNTNVNNNNPTSNSKIIQQSPSSSFRRKQSTSTSSPLSNSLLLDQTTLQQRNKSHNNSDNTTNNSNTKSSKGYISSSSSKSSVSRSSSRSSDHSNTNTTTYSHTTNTNNNTMNMEDAGINLGISKLQTENGLTILKEVDPLLSQKRESFMQQLKVLAYEEFGLDFDQQFNIKRKYGRAVNILVYWVYTCKMKTAIKYWYKRAKELTAKLKQKAAICIQTAFRGYRARIFYIILRDNYRKQKELERLAHLRYLAIINNASRIITRMFHRNILIMRFKRRKSAVMIQCAYRRHIAIKILRRKQARVQLRLDSAIKIQCKYRQHLAIRKVSDFILIIFIIIIVIICVHRSLLLVVKK